MSQLFGPDFFKNNRKNLIASVGQDSLLIVGGNGLLQQTGDNAYPFVQDSNFWYLTGVEVASAVLVIEPNGQSFLVAPTQTYSQDVFNGKLDFASLIKTSGVDEILDVRHGWSKIEQISQKYAEIGTTLPDPVFDKRSSFFTNPNKRMVLNNLRRRLKDKPIFDIRPQLANLRMIKQPAEIKALKQAIAITKQSIMTVEQGSFSSEAELEAALVYEFRKRGAARQAFAPIVANGQNATTLHYNANNQPIDQQKPTVLDVGASFLNYSADISRTLVFQQPDEFSQAVIEAVSKVQKDLIAWLKPGRSFSEYEQLASDKLAEAVKQLLPSAGEIDSTSVRQFFPHAVGHFLGLDVHDVGDYSKPMQPGMVLTCEPGLYFKDRAVGVRIEDDILITKNGAEIL